MSCTSPGRPVLLVVDDDAALNERICEQLARRYSNDYDVLSEESTSAGLEALARLSSDGAAVALVMCNRAETSDGGHDFFSRVRVLHPEAKRVLLVEWGAWADRATADDPPADGARRDRLLRNQALAFAGRVLPPDDHRVPARVGAAGRNGSTRDHHRRSPVVVAVA